MRVSIDKEAFLIDGKRTKIISGAIHYFRVVPEYWYDRLAKLKACGFNTVETYMPWNLHEAKEGHFDFTGILDIEKFIEIAESLDLYVIVRPGPYICAEWDFGGLPSWLLAKDNIKLRVNDALFLDCVRRYFHEVFAHLKGHLIENGGNIIMMQVENEYGSYGMDHAYMQSVADIYQEEQMPVFLFTSDGDDESMLNGGGVPHIFKVVNFGSDTPRNFKNLRKVQPEGPLMCGEFWNGWFDHWGEEHHVRDADDTASEFATLLDMGGNVNFYMFHGGTNFNFWNGANYYDKYAPTVTSYDYHCLLSENGDRTPKYYACQKVLKDRGFTIPQIEVQENPRYSYGKVQMTSYAPLFEQLGAFASNIVKRPYVLPMEKLGQAFGFVLYRTQLKGPFQKRPLKIMGLHDRAYIYTNGQMQAIYERSMDYQEIEISVAQDEVLTLDILVENMGRVNYGPELYDYKGITKAVLLGLQEVHDWEMYTLEMNDFSKVAFKPVETISLPALYEGYLEVEEAMDTFIYLEHFKKGNVFINGFNIGRYFQRGPQKSLYVPAPLLKKGKNIIQVFSLEGSSNAYVEFKDVADLG